MPEVRSPLSLAEWAAELDDCQRLVLDPAAGLKLSSLPIVGHAISVLVGPEGGFDSKELDDVQAMGVTPVSLGTRILRTETAGPAAITILQAGAGEF